MSEQYISGEEYRARQVSTAKKPRKVVLQIRTIMLVIGALLLCAVSFAAGISYQKHHAKTVAAVSAGQFSSGGFAGPGASARHFAGGIGQVTAVSDTSITVNSLRTGSSTTYAINSNTAITDNGQTVSASDIKTGDNALVMSSDGKTADRIVVNPSFGGDAGTSGGPTTIKVAP